MDFLDTLITLGFEEHTTLHVDNMQQEQKELN
jgi:hypothetical protein